MKRFRGLLFVLLLLTFIPLAAYAQCTITMSDEGIVRLQSYEEHDITWNEVPGASSYYVQETIEGLNEPGPPDFTFGGPYTESHNFEGRGITSFRFRHIALWKVHYRVTVTALNHENAAFQPCSDSAVYVVEPDTELATIAATRYIPIAGKTPGANGAHFTTSLVLMATGHTGNPDDPEWVNFYQGRIWFRRAGTPASTSDPSIPYGLNGDQTVVIDDVMAQLGAQGVGTLEIVPRSSLTPAPHVDAIVENHLGNGQKIGVRVPSVLGRDLIARGIGAAVGIRSMSDARMSVGVRPIGGPATLRFQHYKSDGSVVETVDRFSDGNATSFYALQDLFAMPIEPGDRVLASYWSFDLFGADGQRWPGAKAGLLFFTETGNLFNNPNVIYREPLNGRYANGFEPVLVE